MSAPVDRDVKMMVPVVLDVPGMVADLIAMGWMVAKLEQACGFSVGYIHYLRKNPEAEVSYQRAARLYNLWCDEQARGTERAQSVATPTT